jgi:asparagine synthase (glutamine-hydrolysing)
MCGIAGIWNYATGETVDRDLLRRMTDVIAHRGPDDHGMEFDDAHGVGFGFRRLAIIDLSPAGHQPMCNEDGTVWLVFNGEIYNYAALRPRLEAQGHRFRSRTDSEVIIHHYEEHGADCVRDFNGMFGFAIWDSKARRLVLARDRLGKKPLYYRLDGGRLRFASELKSLLQEPGDPPALDWRALGEYLATGYVPPPRTIFQGISKLPPGHVLVFENGEASIRRYWDWLPAFAPDHARTEQQWIDDVRTMLQTAVRDRLMSDVPLGAFLSGGIDSSAVVATMAGMSDRPVKTFSIGFTNAKYNELEYARTVAEHFGTDHHEEIVEPESLRELLPRLVRQFDEPFGDSSALPTYYVARMARRHVTVCLSGDGGDEAFGGYERYSQALREAVVDRVPAPVRGALFALPAALIPPGAPGHRLARRMTLGAGQRYAGAMRLMPPQLLRSLLTDEAARTISPDGTAYVETFLARGGELDLLSRMQYADAMTYLPEDILVKVDRTSMLNSLEVRCPLLDYRLLELAARMPAELRVRGGQGKYPLKRAMRGVLPDAVLDRPKMGFGVPLREWFRGESAGYVADVLLDRRTLERGLFRPESLRAMVEQHRDGSRTLDTPIWLLLVLELWFRTVAEPHLADVQAVCA